MYDEWTKMSKSVTEPMVEYCALYTKLWTDLAKTGIQASSELVQSQSDHFSALSQSKTPDEFFSQQTKWLSKQTPKTFEYFTQTLDSFQENFKESNKLFQKHFNQFTKTEKSTQK